MLCKSENKSVLCKSEYKPLLYKTEKKPLLGILIVKYEKNTVGYIDN